MTILRTSSKGRAISMANNDRYWYRMKIWEEMESEVILISSRKLTAAELDKRAERCRVKGETTFLGVKEADIYCAEAGRGEPPDV